MVKTNWLILPILIALVILPRLSIDFYLPSLPAIGSELDANDTLLQMTLTIFMFGYALSMLLAGQLSDILGRKRVLIYGLSLYFIATFACAISTSIIFLIIARFLQALGGCCGTVIARVMVKDFYARDEQIKILAHLSAAVALCPLMVPIVGGFVQMYLGWRASFYVLFLFALVLIIISKNQMIDPHRTGSKPISMHVILNQYKSLLSHRLFLGYSFVMGFGWSNYFVFTLASPFLFQKTLHFNSVMFGVLFAIVILGYLMGTQLTKHFANKLGWDRAILIATLINLSGALLLITFACVLPLHGFTIIVPMVVIMIGVGIIIPCTQGAVMQPFSQIAGAASGLFFFIQMLFGAIFGCILQTLRSDTLLPLSMIILVSSVLALVSFYKLIWQTKPEEIVDEHIALY